MTEPELLLLNDPVRVILSLTQQNKEIEARNAVIIDLL